MTSEASRTRARVPSVFIVGTTVNLVHVGGILNYTGVLYFFMLLLFFFFFSNVVVVVVGHRYRYLRDCIPLLTASVVHSS